MLQIASLIKSSRWASGGLQCFFFLQVCDIAEVAIKDLKFAILWAFPSLLGCQWHEWVCNRQRFSLGASLTSQGPYGRNSWASCTYIYVMLNWWSITLIMFHFGEESQFLFCLEALLHKRPAPSFLVLSESSLQSILFFPLSVGHFKKWNDHCDGHSVFQNAPRILFLFFFLWNLPCIMRNFFGKGLLAL